MTESPELDVVLLYSATGNGHKSIAQAIHASIVDISDVKCSEIEVFDSIRPRLIKGWPSAYSRMATRSEWLYNILFHLTDVRWISTRISDVVFALAKDRISQVLRSSRPDVIVATAPFVGNVAARAREKLQLNFRIVNVVSDLVTPHASWACLEADATVVCSSFAKERLLKAGMKEEKIIETSLPVQKEFHRSSIGKRQHQRELGLEPGRFTIVISGGSLGAGRVLPSAIALNKEFPESQLLIVAGYNKRLRDLLQSRFGAQDSVHVYGFTDQMPALVGASDVVISKGGPSSIMEARAARRPVIIFDEVGIQEKGNGDLIESLGAGFHASSVNDTVEIVKILLRKREAKDAESRPYATDGAREVAEIVVRNLPLDNDDVRRA